MGDVAETTETGKLASWLECLKVKNFYKKVLQVM
jgi:hypothetical protein